MIRRRILLAAVPVVLVALATAWGFAQSRPPSFPRGDLVIETAAGAKHKFTAEVADTDERRAYGLMNRDSMPADHGMIFDFKADRGVAMWMRNTRIPLDMLFIDRQGRVVNIRERAVPFDESTIASEGPVRSVLELNGGTVARLGIKPGDRIRHPIFGNLP
ncbi:MAG: DUF192 domain-containing protein [Alphaproteobacteria bacterium]|nr:DUF192 domain-containing protein [Alphaproteobacteria bacterium]